MIETTATKLPRPTERLDIRKLRKYPSQRPSPRRDELWVRRRRVTIAAGFRCRNGIVLCTDSEMTYQEALKVNESKMLHYTSSDSPFHFIMTGAGDWDYVQATFQKVVDRLEGDKGKGTLRLQDALEDTLVEMYGTHIPLAPEPRPDLSVLVAAFTPEEPQPVLIKSANTLVIGSIKFECIGIGAVLARYLADSFYADSLSLSQGVSLATYILRIAKNYVPKCGGQTSIATFSDSAEINFDFDAQVAALESYFSSVESEIGSILFQCPDEDLSDAQFNESLQRFSQTMKRLRHEKRRFPLGPWDASQ
jgi:hypothetical protein